MPTSRSRIWKRVALAAAGLLLLAVLAIGYSIYHTWSLLPESYAAWTTGNLMVEYLQTHTNQWPRSWEDMRSATNSLQKGGMPVYLPLEKLQQFVKIDWKADARQLQQTLLRDSNATLRVVTRLDGVPLRALWGKDTEPNGKIERYLRQP
jgi:hypothetical protein